MSWRTNPEAIPNSPRDFAEKLDAVGWNGLSAEEHRLLRRDALVISSFLSEAKGKALLVLCGIASSKWVPSPEKKGGKYSLIERIKAKAAEKRANAADRANQVDKV
jgi:hypothetical protein